MAEKKEVTLLDLEAMANETLDAIPEAPDFNNPPAGEYRIQCKEAKIDKYKSKDDPDTEKQRLKITYSVVETLNVADKNEQPVPNESMFTETFQATTEGLSYFKKRIREVMNVEDTAGVTLADMMTSVGGSIFTCRITIKKTPNPSGGVYENLNMRIIPPSKTA